MVLYNPFDASQYIQLPKRLRKLQVYIKIFDDHHCAQWCILAHLYPKYRGQWVNRNGVRNQRSTSIVDYIEYSDQLVTTGVLFPLKLSDISKLEKSNDLSINVFSFDSKELIIPIRISEETAIANDCIVDLLTLCGSWRRKTLLFNNGLIQIMSYTTIKSSW